MPMIILWGRNSATVMELRGDVTSILTNLLQKSLSVLVVVCLNLRLQSIPGGGSIKQRHLVYLIYMPWELPKGWCNFLGGGILLNYVKKYLCSIVLLKVGRQLSTHLICFKSLK